MIAERVPLRHAGKQPQSARLREPRGHDELALAGVDTRAAVQLLDALLDGAPPAASELSASDRDALLAALHRALWGDRIVASLRCPSCAALYDLSFELSALQRQLLAGGSPARITAPRTLEDQHGQRWRLSTADAEDAAAQLGLAGGRAQLLTETVDGPDELDAARISQCLEALAPLLDVELDTRCAECGQAQLAHFDIQSFALQRLLDERDQVLNEVHALARGYGWALPDILSLPRSLRRSLVQRLGADAPALA